jgi:hypothetical protein
MRHMILAMLTVLSLAFAGLSAAAAAPISTAAGNAGIGSTITKVQYGYCARLRFRCEHKYELGEVGEGNCRRYRIECRRPSYCERLRQACRYKYERGEVGMGNCRRWRYECGRGW